MENKYIDISNIKQEIIYKNYADIINNKNIIKVELYRIKPKKIFKKFNVRENLIHFSNLNFL